MKHWLIGTAIVLLASGPLAAQGHGRGQGNEGGHGNATHGPKMQGPAMKGPSMKGPSMSSPAKGNAAHGNSGHRQDSMASAKQSRAPQHGNDRGKGNGHGQDRPAMVHAENARAPQHGQGNDKGKPVAAANRQASDVQVRVLQDGRHYYSQRETRPRFDFAAAPRGLIDGCPPGLARKNNGCRPPGLAKQAVYQPAWWGLTRLGGDRYLYDDGYLLRLNGDTVAGYVPLLGGALSVGNVWPSTYAPLPVPPYYVDYYDLGPVGSYRYADDVLYRVDPATSAITSIAGLLTGDDIRIGSPMPPGYDIYNVPYPYRGQYADGPDAWYRYSDGYIYQVDPTTQLVTAAIDLLAS
jgi:hypothetical protein